MPLSKSEQLKQAHQNMLFMMGQLNRQWRRVVDKRLKPMGLTEAMWLPLMHLDRATQPMRQKDLAASLGLDSSSVVRLLDGLEQAGLIARAGHADRRAKTIDITPLGLETAQQVKQLLLQDRARLFESLDDDEILVAYSALRKLDQRMESLNLDGQDEAVQP